MKTSEQVADSILALFEQEACAVDSCYRSHEVPPFNNHLDNAEFRAYFRNELIELLRHSTPITG